MAKTVVLGGKPWDLAGRPWDLAVVRGSFVPDNGIVTAHSHGFEGVLKPQPS